MTSGFEMRPDGTIVGFGGRPLTIEEALEVQRRYHERTQGGTAPRESRKATPPPAPEAPPQPKLFDPPLHVSIKPSMAINEDAMKFLATIASSGKVGIASSVLAEELGIDRPNGLSSPVKAAKAMVEARGGTWEKVAWTRRQAHRGSVWFVNATKLRDMGLLEDVNG